MSESKTNVLGALARLAIKISKAELERNPNLNYQIVSYDSLIEKIRPEAVELGLFMIPDVCTQTNCTPYENNGRRMNYDSYIFIFRLYHAPSGEFISVSVPSVGVDNQDKGPGKAVTYAAKSAWLQVLMLIRGEADDGDRTAAMQQRGNANPPPQQPRPPVQPQQPLPAVYTADVRTWKQSWVDELNKMLNYAKNEKAIHDLDSFSWLGAAQQAEEILGNAAGLPEVVRKAMLSQYVGWLVHTATKTRHEKATIDSVKTNFEQFEKYAGPDIAAKVRAKVGA